MTINCANDDSGARSKAWTNSESIASEPPRRRRAVCRVRDAEGRLDSTRPRLGPRNGLPLSLRRSRVHSVEPASSDYSEYIHWLQALRSTHATYSSASTLPGSLCVTIDISIVLLSLLLNYAGNGIGYTRYPIATTSQGQVTFTCTSTSSSRIVSLPPHWTVQPLLSDTDSRSPSAHTHAQYP